MPLNEWDDNSIPLPESQDLMRYELARKGSMPLQSNGSDVPLLPSEAAGQYVPVPIEKPQPYSTATNIYQAAADRLGLTAVPQALMAAMSSFPSEVAKGIGQPEASAVLQYQPTSRSANQMLQAYDQFHPLGSNMGVGPLPETWQLPASLTANDLRVVAKQNLERIREAARIKEDFQNAQSGIRRESNLGGNTYGANIQSAAEGVGDVLASRQAAGKSAIPGIPDIIPETNMYAVRPVGQGQYIEPTDLPNGTSALGKVYGNLANEMAYGLKFEPDAESRFQDYYNHFLMTTPELEQAWQDFASNKISEMYPDAPDAPAARSAFNMAFPGEVGSAERLKRIEEFRSSPEAIEAVQKRADYRQALHDELYLLKNAPRKGLTESEREVKNEEVEKVEKLLSKTKSAHLPTQAEIDERIKAIHQYLGKEFKTDLTKWVGTGQGPMMELAKRGITHLPASEILGLRVNDSTSAASQILRERRTEAGMPSEGLAGQLLNTKNAEIKTATDAFNKLNSRKNQLAMQSQAELPDTDPTANPILGAEYKELTNQIDNAFRAKSKLEKEAENLKVAQAYEALNDLAYQPTTAGRMRNMPYGQQQFYPNLFNKKEGEFITPNEAPMFNIEGEPIRDLGYSQSAKAYTHAIMNGEIPLDPKTGKPSVKLDKFIEEHTAPRIRQEERERIAERDKLGNLNKYMKQVVDQLPAESTFGNTKALEITDVMPWEDIRRHVSLAGLVFDHCIAQSNAPHPGINPFTGQKYTHSYPVDPVTGKARLNPGEDESVNHASSYMTGTRAGEKRITVLMDKESGMPVGAIEFRDQRDGKFNLGYMQAHKTDSISRPYREAFKDYLNARSDIIRGAGNDLSKHDIIDTSVAGWESKASQTLGIPKADIVQLNLPRFVSKEDIKNAAPAPSATLANVDTHASLIARKNQLVDHIEEYRHDLRDAQRDDPTDHEEHERIQGMMDEARNQIADVNSRLENISNNVRNAPAMPIDRYNRDRIPTPRDIADAYLDAQYTRRINGDLAPNNPPPEGHKKGGIIRMNQGGTPNPEDTYGTFSYTPDYYAEVADNISPEGRSGGYNDAARHVLAAADLTRRIESVPLIGKYIADPIVNAAGHVHEYANYLENIGGKKPQTIEDMQQDLYNNAVGRKLGAGSKSFQEIIDRTPAVLDVAPYRKEEGKVFVRNPNEVKTPYKPFGAFNEGGSVNTDDMRYELLRKN